MSAPMPKTDQQPEITESIGIWVERMSDGTWCCVLSQNGKKTSKGPLPRPLFLRELHRALDKFNDRTLRISGVPRG